MLVECMSIQAWDVPQDDSNRIFRKLAEFSGTDTNILAARNNLANVLCDFVLPNEVCNYVHWINQVYKSNYTRVSPECRLMIASTFDNLIGNESTSDYASQLDSTANAIRSGFSDLTFDEMMQITALLKEKVGGPYKSLAILTPPFAGSVYDADFMNMWNNMPLRTTPDGATREDFPPDSDSPLCAYNKGAGAIPVHVTSLLSWQSTDAKSFTIIPSDLHSDHGDLTRGNKFVLYEELGLPGSVGFVGASRS